MKIYSTFPNKSPMTIFQRENILFQKGSFVYSLQKKNYHNSKFAKNILKKNNLKSIINFSIKIISSKYHSLSEKKIYGTIS